MSEIELKTMNLGHRKRLRNKILKSDLNYLEDYEILEMLLFYVFKRSDTKTKAKSMLRKFKSLAGVLCADPAMLKDCSGLGDSTVVLFKLLQTLYARVNIEGSKSYSVIDNWFAVLKYCRLMIGYSSVEMCIALYLNKRNILIHDEIIQKGTIDRVSVYPREIVKKCASNGAAAVILVHNHPSGDNNPSEADVIITKSLKKALEQIGVVLHDHIIITSHDHFSFKKEGII